MGLSLRDLMKREKESRKRKTSEEEDANRNKFQKVSQPNEDNSLKDEVAKVKESLTSDSSQKTDKLTRSESQKEKLDQLTSESTGFSNKPEDIDESEVFSVPPPLNKLKANLTNTDSRTNKDNENQGLKRTLSENSTDLEVLEETYELLEDDESPTVDSSLVDKDLVPELEFGSGSKTNSKNESKTKNKQVSSLLDEYGDYNDLSKDSEDNLNKDNNLRDENENYSVVDENRLVYEQLNTAYCSNLDYEHENVLREAGVKDNLGVGLGGGLGLDLEDGDYDDEQGGYDGSLVDLVNLVNQNAGSRTNKDKDDDNKNVITSSNFGVSTLSVSSTDNLPVGFFDDQNVDAKARGKLTAKEAQNKIKELSRKRSSYLKEAKYIQQKYMEDHREQTKMENDLLDHKETYKELQDKLAKIKDDLNVDTNDLKVDPDRDSKVEEVLKQYSDLDYDDLSWMSRSIV